MIIYDNIGMKQDEHPFSIFQDIPGIFRRHGRLQGKLLQEIGASQRKGINGGDEADDLRI